MTTTSSDDKILAIPEDAGIRAGEASGQETFLQDPSSEDSPARTTRSTSSQSSLNSNGSSKSKKQRKSTSLPLSTVEYLKAWMMSPEHITHPYPTDAEKAQIMADTGIEMRQLTNWFVNNRKRYWKPRVEAQLAAAAAAENNNKAPRSPITVAGSKRANRQLVAALALNAAAVTTGATTTRQQLLRSAAATETPTTRMTTRPSIMGTLPVLPSPGVSSLAHTPPAPRVLRSNSRGSLVVVVSENSSTISDADSASLASDDEAVLVSLAAGEQASSSAQTSSQSSGEEAAAAAVPSSSALVTPISKRPLRSVSLPPLLATSSSEDALFPQEDVVVSTQEDDDEVTAVVEALTTQNKRRRRVSYDEFPQTPRPKFRRVSLQLWQEACQTLPASGCPYDNHALPSLEEAAQLFGYSSSDATATTTTQDASIEECPPSA